MVSPSGINIKNVHIAFPKLRDKLVFAGMPERNTFPRGKGDREAVDEEWRHLIIRNAANSNSTDFSNVPF